MPIDAGKLPVTIRQCRRARLFRYMIALGCLAAVFFAPQTIGIASATVGVILLLALEFIRTLNAVEIDRQKVTLSVGFFSVHTTTVYYEKVTDIRISQTLWQRLLRYGTIYVNTAGHNEYEIMETRLPNPHALRTLIESLKHQVRPK
ncbi:PH domain-containing protein [Candidatus Woesearchaeota archaeon]|nr:PH domain-containing protein [Candidatus Woesearchaeota archaeon]